jgi:phage shock protein A
MGRFSRLSDQLRARVKRLLDADVAGSGNDVDRAYEQMRGQLREIEQAVTDVVTERERLVGRIDRLEEELERHDERAHEAVQRDDDDTARTELEQKRRKQRLVETLEAEQTDLGRAEEELLERRDELAERVRDFRTRKEQLKARKQVAETKADVAESTSGAGSGSEGFARTREAAENDVLDAEARAAAMEELREEGVFDGPVTPEDDVQAELDELETERTVESELETIRDELDDADESEREGDDEDDPR